MSGSAIISECGRYRYRPRIEAMRTGPLFADLAEDAPEPSGSPRKPLRLTMADDTGDPAETGPTPAGADDGAEIDAAIPAFLKRLAGAA